MLEEATAREGELRTEIEKYFKSNEDLFTQNEHLSKEVDVLRSQQIQSIANEQQLADEK